MKVVSVERLTLIGLGITILALLMIGGIALNIAMPFNVSKSVEHSQSVVAGFHNLREKFILAENNQLNYFLTKDRASLETRDDLLNELETDFRRLQMLTIDGSPQQNRMLQLDTKITKYIDVMHANQRAFR